MPAYLPCSSSLTPKNIKQVNENNLSSQKNTSAFRKILQTVHGKCQEIANGIQSI